MNKVISGLLILSIVLLAGCTVNYIKETDSGNSDLADKTTPLADKTTPQIERDCFPFCDDADGTNQKVTEKTFTISGVNQFQEISPEQPVRLVISGVENEVTVFPGTTVNSIIVSGTDIIINLPEGSNPQITDSGVGTTITYS